VVAVTGEHDERALIEAAQADPARFVELYERHFDRVYAYVIRRTGRRDEAEDITSDVFERALTNLPRFEWRGVPFVAWLYRIAANALADRRKQTARPASAPPPAIPHAREPEEIERRAMVYQLVGRLPEAQRQVIELRFIAQKSIREISVALQRSEGAIKQLQLRAFENLRRSMEGRDG
jgi:RNA polymerase sigma-70 factor, ECF subfamily